MLDCIQIECYESHSEPGIYRISIDLSHLENHITRIARNNTGEREKIRDLIKRKDDMKSAEREKIRDPINRKDDIKSD